MKPMDVVYQCLLESEGDIEAGLMAAEYILSIDEHGREHAPAGSGKGGQFVSTKPGRSKHERLEKSPFTFQSPLSEEQIAELDDLTKELETIDTEPKLPTKGQIQTTLDKIGNFMVSIRDGLRKFFDRFPTDEELKNKVKWIKESIEKRYGRFAYPIFASAAGFAVDSIVSAILTGGVLPFDTKATVFASAFIICTTMAESRHQLRKIEKFRNFEESVIALRDRIVQRLEKIRDAEKKRKEKLGYV